MNAYAQTQQAQVAFDHIAGAHAQRGGEAPVDAIDASDLEALPDDGQPGVAGEGATTGTELDVGYGTIWVNGDIRYIAMQFSRLEAFLGAGLTDSGICLNGVPTVSVGKTIHPPMDGPKRPSPLHSAETQALTDA